jgi:hypothetical protein
MLRTKDLEGEVADYLEVQVRHYSMRLVNMAAIPGQDSR